jgi:hypothetical protein
VKHCSVCKCPFPPEVNSSTDVAFAEHLRKAHEPSQANEDFAQAVGQKG